MNEKLFGIHHITAITADGPRNADFWARVMGLRLVKKTVNYDAPEVYHLYYADEHGSPGTVLTFFEFPGVRPGVSGAGMIHTIRWRVESAASLDFWAARLRAEGIEAERHDDALVAADPDGLRFELVVVPGEERLFAIFPEVPVEHALRGFWGVRAYSEAPALSAPVLTDVLGFAAGDWNGSSGYSLADVAGEASDHVYAYDPDPGVAPVQGAGSVHHIAWASRPEDQDAWHARLTQAGVRPTPIIDRTYFKSIYFREPSGVLFEIATMGPGFAVDEPAGELGSKLVLPPRYEPMRTHLEATLAPVHNPRLAGAPEAKS